MTSVDTLNGNDLRKLFSGGNESDLYKPMALIEREIELEGGTVASVAWDPEGKRLSAGCEDGKVRIVNAAEGTVESEIELKGGTVWSVAWDPEGMRLSAGCEDGKVRIVNAAEGTVEREIDLKDGTVFSVAWDPGGKRLSAGCEDGKVHIMGYSQHFGFEIEPHLHYSPDLLPEEVEALCKASDSFVTHRTPQSLGGVTVLHLAGLRGRVRHAKCLMENGADKNALSVGHETALDFVLQRGVETEVREWMEVLGEGARISPHTLRSFVFEKVNTESFLVQMLLENGCIVIDSTQLHPETKRSFAALPTGLAPRVVLSRAEPHTLYRRSREVEREDVHIQSIHLTDSEINTLLPKKQTPMDILFFNQAAVGRVRVTGCVYNDILDIKLVRALSQAPNTSVLTNDLSYAIVQLFWERCRWFQVFELAIDVGYTGALVMMVGLLHPLVQANGTTTAKPMAVSVDVVARTTERCGDVEMHEVM